MTAPVVETPRAPAPERGPRPVAPRPQLRLLRPEPGTEREHRRLVRLLAGVGVVVAVLCVFGVVVAHVVLTQNQFRLDQLEAQASTRQAEYDRLRLQVSELESPARIVKTAQERLGMVAPPKVTYLAPSDEAPPAPTGPPPASLADDGEPGASWSTVKPHLADG
jgi:cell division protein FtsL